MKTISNKRLLGDVLKRLRQDYNYTQKEFISMLEINQSTYSNYENNRSKIPTSFMDKVGKTLNIDIDQYIEDYFNDHDSQEDFLVGYKHPIEQLLFFEELSELRHYIDNINNKETRRELANNLSVIIDEINKYIHEHETDREFIFSEGEFKDNRRFKRHVEKASGAFKEIMKSILYLETLKYDRKKRDYDESDGMSLKEFKEVVDKELDGIDKEK